MARGKPLTPSQIETLVEVYAKTGNYSEAGRAIGVESKVAQRAIQRVSESNRAELHARACESALRRARKSLTGTSKILDKVLNPATPAEGLGIEPRDIAALIRARCDVVRTQTTLAEHSDKRRERRLQREKLRVEIEVLRMRANGTLPPDRHDHNVQSVATVKVCKLPELEPDDTIGRDPMGSDAKTGAVPTESRQ